MQHNSLFMFGRQISTVKVLPRPIFIIFILSWGNNNQSPNVHVGSFVNLTCIKVVIC
jgi:hypothetical protein